jgi:curved DNA-binding protein
MTFGGIFLWGPFGSARMRPHRTQQRPHVDRSQTPQVKPFQVLKGLAQKVGRFLVARQKAIPHGSSKVTIQPEDLTYDLNLPAEEAQRGAWVTIAIDRGQGQERLRVRIPPGTRSGTRLRLRGKGARRGQGSGDLYLTVYLA